MTKEYKRLYESEKIKLIFAPEMNNHQGWNLKVTDVMGFKSTMLKSGDKYTIYEEDGKYVFSKDDKEYYISEQQFNVLKKNGIKS